MGKAGRNDWSGDSGNLSCAAGIRDPRLRSQAVIEPITLALNVGIESRSAASAKSRTCVHGILTAISLHIPPSLPRGVFAVQSK